MKRTVFLLASVALVVGSAAAKEKIYKGPFKNNDLDEDQKLTKEEFIAAKTEYAKEYWAKKGEKFEDKGVDPEKKFGKMFDQYDKDGDGFVSFEEWKAHGK